MGVAGRIAAATLHSRLTPLVAVAALGLGVLALVATPREEEPQISVPMIDVMAQLPGAGPAEVEQQLVRPIAQRMREIPGVEYVYGHAAEGAALVTVRFKVGEDVERSVSAVHVKLMAALADAPPGTVPPEVVPHGIDDVPILTLTLHGERSPDALRTIALHLQDVIRTVPDVAQTFVTGGSPEQLRVALDPTRLAASGVTPEQVAGALAHASARLRAGEFAAHDAVWLVDIGAPIASAADAARIVVADWHGAPVYLGAIATVTEGPPDQANYVDRTDSTGTTPAVTIAIAKRPGANATLVARQVMTQVNAASDRLLPPGVRIDVTRNYGQTAADKASELMWHLLIATLSVAVLVGLVLGIREAAVVLVAVPVTLALTLFTYYLMGYTLNRITLFALIFSIGILVDDAIVVVENIYRHMVAGGVSPQQAAVDGVDEVGNPTILATFTVIAAILPMAFVSGMMGPYMRPIPVGASAAMLASLGVAFVITPYLALRLLRGHVHVNAPAGDGAPPVATGRYARLMAPLLASARKRRLVYAGTAVLLVASVALVGLRLVQVKMLPFDNKDEFQVILDLPEGTTLETTHAAAAEIAVALRQVPEVRSTEVYAGTAAPFNFNGLVRHYFLRRGANVADLQVDLAPKSERSRQSHAIAVAVRPMVDAIASRYGARAKIAEIPPGPPVLSTLVAEVYAANDSLRLAAAKRVKAVMEATPGVVDVDWSVEAPQRQLTFRIDRVRAGMAGADVDQITQVLGMGLSGAAVGQLYRPLASEPVVIVPQLARARRSSLNDLLALPVGTADGPVPLARFVQVDSGVRRIEP